MVKNGRGADYEVEDTVSGEYGTFDQFLKMVHTPHRWASSVVTEIAAHCFKVHIAVIDFCGLIRGKQVVNEVVYVYAEYSQGRLDSVEEALRRETWVLKMDGVHYQHHKLVADQVVAGWTGKEDIDICGSPKQLLPVVLRSENIKKEATVIPAVQYRKSRHRRFAAVDQREGSSEEGTVQ